MFFTKKSQALHAATGLIALGLLAVSCGGEKKKDERPQPAHVEVDGPSLQPTPEPAPIPEVTPVTPAPSVTPVTPTPSVTPSPDVTPIPEPTPTPAVTPVPEKPSLPAARALTEVEKHEYLTNTDSFIRAVDDDYPRGAGFDTKESYFLNDCMERDSNILQLTLDARPTDEYAIQPLTSARQMKEALAYHDTSLYMSRRIDTSMSDRLGIVAIAKKIRKVESEDSMILRPGFANLDDETFTDRCGQMYKKGEVYGHVYYAVLWLELNEENTREAMLSRLIDSKTLGTYRDLQTFADKLGALKSQLSNTDTLTMKGLEIGYNFSEGITPSFSFDFSPMLKAWSDAADQVELAKVPEIGSIFGSYPDRSTPAHLTGGT